MELSFVLKVATLFRYKWASYGLVFNISACYNHKIQINYYVYSWFVDFNRFNYNLIRYSNNDS